MSFYNKNKSIEKKNLGNKDDAKNGSFKILSDHMSTYLGNKGYTVSKKDLTPEQINKIKDQLVVRPDNPGSPVPTNQMFYAYRESANKLYLPRYYGEKIFGPAKTVSLTEGNDIELNFNGSLRDYQQPVINQYLDYVRSSPTGTAAALLELFCGWGKTSASLYVCSQLRKKTLVIVHKGFLLDQWVERIEQFLPRARIGKIQGPTIDIEDKDIVLCMLQSLVQKNYPSNLFDSFGFTIIDEVHHISSETFSNALFKVVTKYMLGLSATMVRKDGTTEMFKLFLGDILHKSTQKKDNNVEIRAIMYKSDDPVFNETAVDWNGKPQISTMISKLCEFQPRTEFIIQELIKFIRYPNISEEEYNHNKNIMKHECIQTCRNCLKREHYLVENTCCNRVEYCLSCVQDFADCKRKCPLCNKRLKYAQHYIEDKNIRPLSQVHTLVLAHNLSVLDYIYKAFVNRNIASVGYYVGGMKDAELKISSTKQVILATFALANEGLDISTINAEFLITPKTDVVQAVGRALRAKHAHNHPIIYDIYDSHQVFRNQWAKRKAYYNQNNYKIIMNTSTNIANQNKNSSSISTNSDEEYNELEEYEEEVSNSTTSGKCLLKI